MASQWISVTPQLGLQAPGNVDSGYTNTSGVLVPSFNAAIGQIALFRDVGTTQLGDAEFIFLAGVASTVQGSWVTYSLSTGAALSGATTLWAGTANAPFPLAIATAAIVANTWGWYQISGNAIAATSGTVAAGNPLFWQAAGVVSATGVNGKAVLGAIAASANGVPATNQSIVVINRPHAQGQVS